MSCLPTKPFLIRTAPSYRITPMLGIAACSLSSLLAAVPTESPSRLFGDVRINESELPAPVPASERLSLGQAVKLGLRDNPQVAASRYSVLSAKDNYASQKSPINPSISYAALNNTVAPFSYSNGFGLGSNYSAYATLETNGAIRYRTGQAREQFRQAEFDAAATGQSLKLSIVNAYIGLQVANRALEVELKVYENVTKLADLADKRFLNGAGPQSDATRSRITAIQEKQSLFTDVANVNTARAQLNTQLGRSQGAPIDAVDPLVYKPQSLGELAALTKQAESNRPELRSAQANLRALKSVVGLERSAYYPNVEVAKDFGGDGQIFIGMSVPLDLGGIHGAVAKARDDVKAQAAQVEMERQAIDREVRTSFINLAAQQKQVDSYETGILKMSETLVDQVEQGYGLGANNILDVITAESTYRSVESAYYCAVGSYLEAVYALKHAVGDLPDFKGVSS